VPPRLRYVDSAGGKLRYAWRALREALDGPFDLVVAGHINLSALAALFAWANAGRTLLFIHGIDAWTPHPSPLIRWSLRSMRLVAGVSNVTLERFARWSKVPPARLRLLPNCVDLTKFGPGPRSPALARKLGLEGRTVLMTLGRLAGGERYKGFDEVLEVLPALAREIPDIAYLICGDGGDRARLQAKADALGVRDRVVFAGFVPEEEKVEYYRLAHAYVMPSRGEGFGIVFLEALACGVPVLASTADGGREAVLDGRMGVLVDPARREELCDSIRRTLARPVQVPAELEQFSFEAFSGRLRAIAGEALAGAARPAEYRAVVSSRVHRQ
jgi:glycosyltransferase involved in cell wall biosynthesis